VADNSENKPSPGLAATLRNSRWACDLTDDEFARVEAGVFERRIAAGGYVCRKGEPVEHWFGVIDGLLKISSDLESGKTATLTGVPPGGWFGEGSLLKREPRRYDVIVLRDSRVAVMRRETFQWLLDHSICFNRYLLTQLNERLGQFIGLVESERLLDTDARVARCVATLFNPVLYPGLGARLQVSQEELGYLTGLSRQRVNRSLKILQYAGYLSIEYGSITIRDLDGLRRFGG
jgi:CRP-like cAMP-binding protein